jgi:hypothetical protein
MVDAGDPVIRSDEELALSVLRYGKILSRKLENRMQVGAVAISHPSPPSFAAPPHALPASDGSPGRSKKRTWSTSCRC